MAKLNFKDKHFEIPIGQGESLTAKIRYLTKNKWVLLCRGLTGNKAKRSSLDELVDTLSCDGWSSLRFNYRKSLFADKLKKLRTVKSMTKDLSIAFTALFEKVGRQPDVVVARSFGARLAIEALTPYPDVPLVMWAPILWLRTSLELRGRLHEMRRKGKLTIDGSDVGPKFIKSVKDPTDKEFCSWIVPQRRYILIQGADDKVSPFFLVREAKDLIESTGSKVEVHMVSGEHPHPESDVRQQISKIKEALSSTEKKHQI